MGLAFAGRRPRPESGREGRDHAGVYSKAQAERGMKLYADACARCHGASMEGLDVAPPLTGARFLGNYAGQPAAALSSRIRTSMPLDMPGSLGLQGQRRPDRRPAGGQRLSGGQRRVAVEFFSAADDYNRMR